VGSRARKPDQRARIKVSCETMPEDAQGSGEVQKPEKDRKKIVSEQELHRGYAAHITPRINRFLR